MFRIGRLLKNKIMKAAACQTDKPPLESPLTQRLRWMITSAESGRAYRMVLKTEVLLYFVFDHGETILIGVYFYWPGCTFVMETQFPRTEVKHFTTGHFERIFDECVKELDRKHQAGELRYIRAIPWEFYELDAAKVRESFGTIPCTDYESMKQTNGMGL